MHAPPLSSYRAPSTISGAAHLNLSDEGMLGCVCSMMVFVGVLPPSPSELVLHVLHVGARYGHLLRFRPYNMMT